MPLWQRADKALGRHMIWLVLTALTLGILFPEIFSPLRTYAAGLMAVMTFCSSLGAVSVRSAMCWPTLCPR